MHYYRPLLLGVARGGHGEQYSPWHGLLKSGSSIFVFTRDNSNVGPYVQCGFQSFLVGKVLAGCR